MRIKSPRTIKLIGAAPRCELFCGRLAQHVHHEPTEGSTGGGIETRLTLIRLCALCHTQRHAGAAYRTEQEIIAAICRREKCDEGDREAVVFLLKRAPKDSGREWFVVAASEWDDRRFALLEKTLQEIGL